jgi:flagellar hook-basal body complex protein FliE
MSVTGPALSQVVAQLKATAAQAGAAPPKDPADRAAGHASFAAALVHAIDRIDALKQTAIADGHAYERGEPGIGLNDVMVAMQKAEIGLQMGIQMRNRVVNAYKDIMNMQV